MNLHMWYYFDCVLPPYLASVSIEHLFFQSEILLEDGIFWVYTELLWVYHLKYFQHLAMTLPVLSYRFNHENIITALYLESLIPLLYISSILTLLLRFRLFYLNFTIPSL